MEQGRIQDGAQEKLEGCFSSGQSEDSLPAPLELADCDQLLFSKGQPLTSVPPLCRMVNDPATDELIRWSEDGDSFFGESS